MSRSVRDDKDGKETASQDDGAPATASSRLGGSVITPLTDRRRILVVDDNHYAADSLATLLDLMGNETCQAHDGLEAIEAAVRFRPEVVLLDISLPKLSGYDAAREIRRRLEGCELMLVAISGWEEDPVESATAESVFDAYLTKPVEIATLRQLLSGGQG